MTEAFLFYSHDCGFLDEVVANHVYSQSLWMRFLLGSGPVFFWRSKGESGAELLPTQVAVRHIN